jgi:site-specific DNA recombinase
MPPEDWLYVPVPPLVDAAVFAAVQEQLQENRRHARQGRRGARYLLQGLLCCAHCGYAYYGKAISPAKRKYHPRSYAYYRCLGTDAYRFGGQRVCSNHQVRTDLLDLAVWHEASALLEQPQRLEHEYRQRLTAGSGQKTERTAVERQRDKLRQGLARLIDSYTEGYLEKAEFESRVTHQRQRIATLDEQARQLADKEALERELRLLIGRLEDFAAQVEVGLETADWLTRREIIRALVSRVEIDHAQVNVVFRVPPDPFVASPDSLDRGVLPLCRRRDHPTLRGAGLRIAHGPALQHTRVQPLPNQTQEHAITHPALHKRAQLSFVQRVEETLDVKFDDPPASKAHKLVPPGF